MASPLVELQKRYSSLRLYSDESQTRVCIPIASDQIVFQRTTTPSARPASELIEIVESTLGGKFQLPVETSPEKALEPASGRLQSPRARPLATLEVWSLEPGSFDLVLKLPAAVTADEVTAAHLISRFVDQAREVTRIVDNLDLLRFQSGPSLTLKDAQTHLNRLERQSGTRLDTEGLITLLGRDGKASHLLN